MSDEDQSSVISEPRRSIFLLHEDFRRSSWDWMSSRADFSIIYPDFDEELCALIHRFISSI